MENFHGFDFFPLRFDGEGRLKETTERDALLAHLATGVTDVICIAHGFCNDEPDARNLYGPFLDTFRANMARPEFGGVAARKFAVAGVFWPSKQFSEGSKGDGGGTQSVPNEDEEREAVAGQLRGLLDSESTPAQKAAIEKAIGLLGSLEGKPANQDEVVRLMLSLVGSSEPGDEEGFDKILATSGAEVLEKFSAPILLPTAKDDDEGGAMSVSGDSGDGEGSALFSIGGVFKSVVGKVAMVANVTTWYMMKNRSGTVGARGLAPIVRSVKQLQPAVRVHLAGHSLGGRLMTSCSKALSEAPAVQPDSLSLLEAAFSHYGFSNDNGRGKRGFFREVIDRSVVKGPLISTFSAQDTTVGIVYALASRLAGDNAKAIGDEDDEFGGIGRNGSQRTDEATRQALHQAGKGYATPFTSGVIHNLDGSGGLIKNHSDVKNPAVTYAFTTALSQT